VLAVTKTFSASA